MNYDTVCLLDVVSVEKNIFSGLIKKIQVSGSKGELGIYPKHSQLLSLLNPGMLFILDKNDNQHFFYISGGIIEVQPIRISILADIAILGIDLNIDEILKMKKSIENKIKNNTFSHRKTIMKDLSCELAKLRVIAMMNSKNNVILKDR
ncbi:MAG: ATP synthase F1 subunit epsilon [Buchnera aphidicola (Chaetogeoica yunlongensis)]